MIPGSIIEDLKDKKELQGIKPSIIEKLSEDILENDTSLKNTLIEKEWNKRSKEYKQFKKRVRKQLRTIHGVFYKYKDKTYTEWENMLERHRSTKERLKWYGNLYSWIENKNIESLMDIGCGYNPLSYLIFDDIKKFYCTDINREDKYIVQTFFDKHDIDGEYDVRDITKKDDFNIVTEKSNEYDITLMLKLLDTLESQERDITQTILNDFKSQYLLVSFSDKTISGKNNITSEREWFHTYVKKSPYSIIEEKTFGPETYHLLRRQ